MILSIETIETPTSEEERTDAVAQFYQDPVEYSELLASEEVYYNLTKPLQESISRHNIRQGSILDLGCGPGTVANTLQGNFTFTGVDTARPMLIEAVMNQKYDKGYWGRIEDVIPVLHSRKEGFDCCIALSSLYYVENPLPLIEMLADMAATGIILSFDKITAEYKVAAKEAFGVALPLFDHSNLLKNGLPGWKMETWEGHAWHAPRVGLSIDAQVITLIRE
jgi:predicted TPR repeat methyltransferase